MHKLRMKSSGLPASHAPDMKSVRFEKCLFTVGLSSRVGSSEAADVWAICTGENKASEMVRRESSGNLISQRDFLFRKISILEIDCDGKLKMHDGLSYTGQCVCSPFTSV